MAPRIAEIIDCLASDSSDTLTIAISYRLTRTGQALRLIQENGTRADTAVDPALVRLLVRARKWWGILEQGEIDIATLARREGVNDSYVTRVVRVAFLSPQIVETILAGGQRRGLDAAQHSGSGEADQYFLRGFTPEHCILYRERIPEAAVCSVG